MEKLKDIVFYNMDKAIRTYRSYAQKKLRDAGFKITVDQWLVIKAILENPGISQQEIGAIAFKDNASVTRIIALLVKSAYLKRDVDNTDRRKTLLEVTPEGKQVVEDVQNLVMQNRQTALARISSAELKTVNEALKIIIRNCN
ncbi:MAG: MarR family transcriptional regulator [Flavobacterium sp.]|nr:MAG: MarR family transcriptional regulator [Flavobacterium sp.]